MDKNTCVGCKSSIPTKEFMNCYGCKQKYDLQCANLSPKRFKKMSQDIKIKWRCPECINKQPKMDNTNTPIRSSLQSKNNEEADEHLLTVSSNVTMRKHTDLRSQSAVDYITEDKLREIWRNEMRKEMESSLETTLRKNVSNQLKAINDQCTGFQQSIAYVSTQYEDLKKDNADLKKLLATTSSELRYLKDENKTLKERVKVLEDDSLKQQQWVRLQNVEITGIPENKQEITADIVLKVSQHIGVNIEASDLEFAHRVQPRRAASAARARPIIARLRQRAVKDLIIAAARKHRSMTAKEIGMGGETDKIYVNEHLTKDNKMLFSSCKQRAKEVNYKYIWTKNCRIFVRKSDTSPPIAINSTSDFIKIV